MPPAFIARIGHQQHQRQTGPLELVQQRIRQSVQAPGDQDRVHWLRLDDLEQLVRRQTLSDDDQVLGGLECRSQALLELLVTQTERQSQAR